MGDYLSVTETADALGVTVRTVRRWLKDGTLTGTRLPGRGGGEWRISKGEVSKLLTEGRPRSEVNPLDSVPRCQALKADGTPCRGLAVKGSRFCRYHTKAQEAQR